jgi:hypothetical protein
MAAVACVQPESKESTWSLGVNEKQDKTVLGDDGDAELYDAPAESDKSKRKKEKREKRKRGSDVTIIDADVPEKKSKKKFEEQSVTVAEMKNSEETEQGSQRRISRRTRRAGQDYY